MARCDDCIPPPEGSAQVIRDFTGSFAGFAGLPSTPEAARDLTLQEYCDLVQGANDQIRNPSIWQILETDLDSDPAFLEIRANDPDGYAYLVRFVTDFADGDFSIWDGWLAEIDGIKWRFGPSATVGDVLDSNDGENDGEESYPVANPDARTIAPGESVIIDVVANDVFEEGTLPSTFVPFTQPSNGAVREVGAAGRLVYTPAGGFEGVDSFDYTIEDSDGRSARGTVTITVGDPGSSGGSDRRLEDYFPDDLPPFAGWEFEDQLEAYAASGSSDASVTVSSPSIYLDEADGRWSYDESFERIGGETEAFPSGGDGGASGLMDELARTFNEPMLRVGVEFALRVNGFETLEAVENVEDRAPSLLDYIDTVLDGLEGLLTGDDPDAINRIFDEDLRAFEDAQTDDPSNPGDWLIQFFRNTSPSTSQSAISVNLTVGPNATFAEHRDTFFGASIANTVTLGSNDDTAFGNAGADRLFGEEGEDSLSGGVDADTLDGGAGRDTLDGGEGDDWLAGGPDADALEGGPGRDTPSYASLFSALRIETAPNGTVTVAERGAIDTLKSIERIQTADGAVVFDFAGTDEAVTTVYRLYASAFGRTPDEDGLRFWTDRLDAGEQTLASIAGAFVEAPEFLAQFPEALATADPAGFVAAYYRGPLDRAPDPDGQAFWTDRLLALGPEEGTTLLLQAFAASTEFMEASAPLYDDGVFVV